MDALPEGAPRARGALRCAALLSALAFFHQAPVKAAGRGAMPSLPPQVGRIKE